MIASTLFWFFLAQMPGDDTWMPSKAFDNFTECETYRAVFRSIHPNFDTQECRPSTKEKV